MMNNKGFAVSAVLYTLLIAFLLFLGAALAMFSSSSSLVSNANNDLINGNYFAAQQVRGVFADKTCKALGTKTDSSSQHYWYEGNALVRINTRYGTMYWPKDFGQSVVDGKVTGTYKDNKNIKVECILPDGSKNNCEGYDLTADQVSEPEPPAPAPVMKNISFESGTIRIRFNDILGDENPDTCPITSKLYITKNSYDATIELIKNIENFESIRNYDKPDLNIINGEATCFSGNLKYDPSDESDVCNNNLDQSGFEQDFEVFEMYLEGVSPSTEGTTYEYNRDTRIFTQKIKLGQMGQAVTNYFPVIYKFRFQSDQQFETDCVRELFNTLVYYDLVPVGKYGSSVNDDLLITGKDIDQFALFYDQGRVSRYFFNSGEYDKATDVDSTKPEEPIQPVIKPKSWGNLYIKDNLTEDFIKKGKFSLFDICK